MGIGRPPENVWRWRAGALVAALCSLAGPRPLLAASADAALDPTVSTTISVVSSSNPSFASASVTFTAGVISAQLVAFPSGTVAFFDGDSTLAGCGAVTVVPLGLSGLQHVGIAECTIAFEAGIHPIRASYSGNGFHFPSDSAIVSQQVLVVADQVTTTTLSSDLNPSGLGASVVLVAQVKNLIAPAPGGHVHFASDGVPIAACTARPLSDPGGVTFAFASCATDSLPAGNHTIVATYSGDDGNLASVSPDFVQSVTSPDACAPFNDVEGASGFCPNVQWLANRGITLGCSVGSYCPMAPVSRLAMAALMNRLGATLTVRDLNFWSFSEFPDVATPLVCLVGHDTNIMLPQRAYVRARASFRLWGAVTSSTSYSIEHVFTDDAGVTWTAVPGSMMLVTLVDDPSLADHKTVAPFGIVDLQPGRAYRFALRVARVQGTTDPRVECANFVHIRTLDGPPPP